MHLESTDFNDFFSLKIHQQKVKTLSHFFVNEKTEFKANYGHEFLTVKYFLTTLKIGI